MVHYATAYKNHAACGERTSKVTRWTEKVNCETCNARIKANRETGARITERRWK